MPHVVFDNRINLEELFEKFSPIVQKEPCLVKITEMYIDNQKQKMLLPVVVIDQRHHDFFQIHARVIGRYRHVTAHRTYLTGLYRMRCCEK